MAGTGRYRSRIKIESPSVAALAKRSVPEFRDSSPSTIAKDDSAGIEIKPSLELGQACKGDAKNSPSKLSVTRSSPTKSTTVYTPLKL